MFTKTTEIMKTPSGRMVEHGESVKELDTDDEHEQRAARKMFLRIQNMRILPRWSVVIVTAKQLLLKLLVARKKRRILTYSRRSL